MKKKQDLHAKNIVDRAESFWEYVGFCSKGMWTFKETNMKVIKTPKFDLWQLFWKGANKRMNHSVPFAAAVPALSARLWKEILIGLAEAEFVPESAMNLCCTDCSKFSGMTLPEEAGENRYR